MTPQDIAAALLARPETALSCTQRGVVKTGEVPLTEHLVKILVPGSAASIGGCFKEVCRLLATALRGGEKREKAEAKAEAIDAALNEEYPGLGIPFRDLKLLFSNENANRSLLYYEPEDRIIPGTYSAVTDTVRTVVGGAAYAAWRKSNQITSRLIYKPYAPRFQRRSKDVSDVNTWSPAPWSVDWTPAAAGCPAELDEYLAAAFLGSDSIDAVKAWLRDATFSRAFPIMVLSGIPGSGKNTFVEAVAAPLVGADNYKQAPRSWGDNGFQAAVTSCRLFFIDEVPINPARRETLKTYHNDHASFERKYDEATGKTEAIYASIVTANNHKNQIQLEYSDRKFFVPDTAPTPLKESIGEAKINRLYALAKDLDFVRQVANYLHGAFAAGASKVFPKTKTFREVCIHSYPPVFQEFIYFCGRSDVIDSKTFAKARRGRGLTSRELKPLIDHYEATFGEKLATLDEGDLTVGWRAQSHVAGAHETL